MSKLKSFAHIAISPKKSMLVKDILIALGWAFLLGFPLFVLHMMLFNFEHDQQMGIPFSIIQSVTQLLPRHTASLTLWLFAIFITAYAIRRAIQQQALLIRTQEKLAITHTQALTDGLTGVWNRAGFESLQEITITRARQQNCPYSMILGDVDGLKRYNDRYGHPIADKALKQITQTIMSQIRSSDAVARYGGDEFAIFCFDLNRDAAECLISRLEEALKKTPLSMSFGIASFPIDGEDTESLIEKADSRLYQAKTRNKILGHPAQRGSDCQWNDCVCGKEDESINRLVENL
jgi:diguanylate cyclase (GGDEF)-like protein